MKYTIKSINEESGDVVVVFDTDNKEQTLGGLPIGDENELKDALENYGRAFEAGLEQSSVTVPQKVKNLINKEQTVPDQES